ncbi:MAG TPA: type II secretion system protein [Pirellulales bacterium]|jgi:prepilin-type N-terminal cleavage/methylation domain-containing protein
MRRRPSSELSRGGFTLVELAVVIVIIGVLASFGVPRFLKSVERSKAAEAFNYLSAVRDSQERYQSQNGTYASAILNLDISFPAPQYFTVADPVAGSTGSLENSWSSTLTRSGSSSGYGAYTVIFTESGFDTTNSTIPNDINPSGATISGSGSGSGSGS